MKPNLATFASVVALVVPLLVIPLTLAGPAHATCARPSLSTFIAKINEIEDLRINDFIARKTNHSPCYLDWSDDGCSYVPNSGSTYNFLKSCKRHDFGYRNLKRAESWYGRDVWRYHNKAVADTSFRRDMTNHCWARDESEISSCLEYRTKYYNVVSAVVSPSTNGDYRYTFLP